jgi:hypothetical protein
MERKQRVLVQHLDFVEPRRKVFEAFLDCFHQLGDVKAYKKSENFIEAELAFSMERGRPTCRATFESGSGRTTVTLELKTHPDGLWHRNEPLEPEVERIVRQLKGANLKVDNGE